MKIALVPLRAIVGDLEGNREKILSSVAAENRKGTELVVFPELALLGYPAQDLLLRADFRQAAREQLDRLEADLAAQKLQGIGVLLGTLWEVESEGRPVLYNAAVLLHEGKRSVRYKTLIPTYDVFHEARYFTAAPTAQEPILFNGRKLGVLVCEDSWEEMLVQGRRQHVLSPTENLARKGAEVLINLSASPFEQNKLEKRLEVLAEGARKAKLPLLYVNYLGAQDEIVFAGESYVFSELGDLVHKQDLFSDSPLRFDVGNKAKPVALEKKITQAQKLESLRQALVWGIREYAEKNRFQKAVLGVSGGIDSALVAVLAAEALGPQNVIGLSMPAKYSSTHSIEDAEALARNVGFIYKNFPIKFLQSTFLMALRPYFQSFPEDITEENLQSRLRGVTVMAFSNKLRAMALATGNKSEFAVGYSTLYGDTCGALAPIGDLYKTEVYELARFVNKYQEVIPQRTLDKPPSAELKPNQTDQDTLPPYDILDAILFQLVEEEKSIVAATEALARLKVKESLVKEIAKKLAAAEFKRHQVPPILKVSSKAFGVGRRYPITARFD